MSSACRGLSWAEAQARRLRRQVLKDGTPHPVLDRFPISRGGHWQDGALPPHNKTADLRAQGVEGRAENTEG